MAGAARRALCLLVLAGVMHPTLCADAASGVDRDGLVFRSGRTELRLTAPREPGNVPIVFIHGMLGSPGNWSVMIAQLAATPAIGGRFQFLTLGYDSLQPIPASARELVENACRGATSLRS